MAAPAPVKGKRAAPVVLGHCLYPFDDDSFMLDGPTYQTGNYEFHDWRFGTPEAPHPATCGTCGRKTDPDFVSPVFRAKHRRHDVVGTYDGYTIVSARFRDFCRRRRLPGVQFVTLPADTDFFWLRSDRTLAFDAEAAGTCLEKRCPTCRAFNSVTGSEVVLKGVTRPLAAGFYRTDLEFASAHEQSPLLIVGPGTGALLRDQKFRGLDVKEILL